ncbi:hypothetical protein [Wenjunlia tyrosinilytica]|nr:hypothetical protein [Wenjunlia tyrosinilytica]
MGSQESSSAPRCCGDDPTEADTPAEGSPSAAVKACVCDLCGEPTEDGATLCPVCHWQQAQRSQCSG